MMVGHDVVHSAGWLVMMSWGGLPNNLGSRLPSYPCAKTSRGGKAMPEKNHRIEASHARLRNVCHRRRPGGLVKRNHDMADMQQRKL